MAGTGGARPGAGAKKGQHRVHVKELKDAIEKNIGMPFQDIQSIVFLKLFNNFKKDKNIKEFLIFNENMCRRVLQNPDNESISTAISGLTKEELESRRNNLLSRLALEAASIKTEE